MLKTRLTNLNTHPDHMCIETCTAHLKAAEPKGAGLGSNPLPPCTEQEGKDNELMENGTDVVSVLLFELKYKYC